MAISSKPYVLRIYPEAGQELALLESLHGHQTATITGYRGFLLRLANLCAGMAAGERKLAMQIVPCDAAAVKASATLTFSGQPSAAETVVIGGVTFTARASGAVANEFNIGADAAASIVALTAAINASATALIAREISAVATSATVCTISASVPGTRGNMIGITETMTNVALGGTVGGCLSGGLDTTQDLASILAIS